MKFDWRQLPFSSFNWHKWNRDVYCWNRKRPKLCMDRSEFHWRRRVEFINNKGRWNPEGESSGAIKEWIVKAGFWFWSHRLRRVSSIQEFGAIPLTSWHVASSGLEKPLSSRIIVCASKASDIRRITRGKATCSPPSDEKSDITPRYVIWLVGPADLMAYWLV